MMEGAFYQPRKTSPTALAIVVLMHGAGLTALALAKPEMFDKVKIPPTVIDFIKEKTPPPEEPPKPVEQAVAPPESVVTHVPPVVDTPPRTIFAEYKPLPPVQPPYIPPPAEIVAPRLDPPAAEVKTMKPARAKANLASYVSDEDYPSNAVRNEEQGTTRFRLGVGSNGHVTDCTVIGSSGSSALDMATCRLMKQRARFTPARNSAGDPTSDSVTSAIRWVLPD
jgi:protein TonB